MNLPAATNPQQSQELESLFYAIEGSLKVQRRFQMFLWAQGSLQAPLPHETLICAWGGIESGSFRHEVFSRGVPDPAFAARLADPVDGLLARLIGAWLGRRRQPCVYLADAEDCPCPPALKQEFRRLGFTRVVAHGPREIRGDFGSFFVFVNGRSDFSEREAGIVDLLMPHLHMALQRVAEQESREAEGAGAEPGVEHLLSERELQVLRWVRDGKTNQEIALILGISPLTVKNHVQKILRKLRVSNRAQAVARGIATRLLGDHPGA
jgi:transcriptional regulator EpsA